MLPEDVDICEADLVQPSDVVCQLSWLIFGPILGKPFYLNLVLADLAAHELRPLRHVDGLEEFVRTEQHQRCRRRRSIQDFVNPPIEGTLVLMADEVVERQR
jgi:hypothetical protein